MGKEILGNTDIYSEVKISELGTTGKSRGLSTDLKNRIISFKMKLAEIETTPLAETFDNFSRDKNPEKEILIWESIAEAYHAFTNDKDDYSFGKKKEIYKALLILSSKPTSMFSSQELGEFEHLTLHNIQELENTLGILMNLAVGKKHLPITITQKRKTILSKIKDFLFNHARN